MSAASLCILVANTAQPKLGSFCSWTTSLLERSSGSTSPRFEEAAAEKYMPQLQHNMWVVAARSAVLSVITGGGKWVEITTHADPLYQHLIVTAERKFWRCVEKNDGDEARQCTLDNCALVCQFFPRSFPLTLLAGSYH
jgi:hypothetical protein